MSIECSPYSNAIFSTGPADDPYIDSNFFIMSQDGGDTWTLTHFYYDGIEFIQDFCFQSIDTIFAASVFWAMQNSGGVYRSTKGGYHWELFGLEGCDVQDLHIHKNYLYAAVRSTYSTTYTRYGIYRYPLDKEGGTWQFVYPHMAFGVASDSQGTLYGLCLQNNTICSYPQGSNTISINTTALATGVYICHFNNGKQVLKRKLVKR